MHAFERQVKERQAQFRSVSPTISAAAKSPTDDVGQRHAYLLAVGHEEENLVPSLRRGLALRYFASRGIKWWRSTRGGDPSRDSDGKPRRSGPTRNMASSQIACVNVLMPLASSPTALTAMLQAIDPDVDRVEQMRYQRSGETPHESLVEFEWVGEGPSLEGTAGTRGANTTSADALLVARMKSGRREGFLLEWKLVEEYRRASNQLEGEKGATRRRRYENGYATSTAFKQNRPTFDQIAYDPVWQLMRMTLLGDLMVTRAAASGAECGVEAVTVVVVCPTENDAYHRSVAGTLAIFAEGEPDPSSAPLARACRQVWNDRRLRFVTPRALVQAARTGGGDLPDGWSDYMQERYRW